MRAGRVVRLGRRIFFLAVGGAFSLSPLAGGCDAAIPVWIDTDPAIGAPWREVDDAFALVIAFHSPELRIAGISATYGNAGLKRTTAVARDLVRRFGEAAAVTESSVYGGAESPMDATAKTAAIEALAETLRKEPLIYLALGPLTDLAAFVRLHPELTSRIQRVIFVGGISPGEKLTLVPGGAFRIHDANVCKDPASVVAVLNSGIPLTLAPVPTSSQLVLEKSAWDSLRGGNLESLYQRSRVWMWFWTSVLHARGGAIFDALAVLAAAEPSVAVAEKRYAAVDQTGNLIASQRRNPGAIGVQFLTRLSSTAGEQMQARLQRRASGR